MLTRQSSLPVLMVALTALLLTACSTGYSSPLSGTVEVAPNRYRVSFSGSTSANRSEVELSLLRRSAEVTLESGHSHFNFHRRDGDSYLLGPYYYSYLPYSPFHRGKWRDYPWGENLRPATDYSVYTEIETLRSDQAARDPDALDALATLRTLQGVPFTVFASATPLR